MKNVKMMSRLRIVICILVFLMSLLFIVPVTVGVFSIGNIIGIVICMSTIGCLIFYYDIKKIIFSIYKNKWGKVCIIITTFIIVTAIIFSVVLSIFMIKATINTPPENSTVVVLGCKVNGSRPSLMLTKRLDATLNYLNRNPEAVCIVSGGQGKGEDISEAKAMHDYLAQNGILTNRIYIEDKSSNTSENIEFSKKIIQQHNLNTNIAIITDGFHQLRASIISKEWELTPYSVSAKTPWYVFPTYYIRELLALVEQILLK